MLLSLQNDLIARSCKPCSLDVWRRTSRSETCLDEPQQYGKMLCPLSRSSTERYNVHFFCSCFDRLPSSAFVISYSEHTKAFCAIKVILLHITAVFISHHLGPIIQTLAIFGEGESTLGYTFTSCGILYLPWNTHFGTRDHGLKFFFFNHNS
jgi:hypothetical protein